jgi:Family of unknown function (DUF5522)
MPERRGAGHNDALEILADRPLREPHRSRLDPADPGRTAILAAHDAALAADASGYLDPRTGRFVFSAGYLADRGWCCTNGCRHCPYIR